MSAPSTTTPETAPFQPLAYGEWESTPEAARIEDPLAKVQAYDNRLRKDLFKAGLYDGSAEAEITAAGADQALRAGLIADPAEYAPAAKPRDPNFLARQLVRRGDTAKAQDIYRYQSLLSRPDTDPDTLERARQAAQLDPETENELVRKAVRAGELPFAIVPDKDGNAIFEIDPELGALDRQQILDLAGDDVDPRFLPDLERQLTRVPGTNYTPAQFRQSAVFDGFLKEQIKTDEFLFGQLEQAQSEYDRTGQLSPETQESLDRSLAALDVDGEFSPETRGRLIRDTIRRGSRPEDFDPENPQAHIQYLEDGTVWLPEQVIFDQAKHDQVLDSLTVTPEQKENAKKLRQGRLESIAPAMVDAMGADPDALEFFEKSKAAGKSDVDIATEWYSKPENYSSFSNRARSFGMSLIEAGPGLFQSIGALAGSESAMESLKTRAQDTARNQEYARLFGDSYGVGQSLLNTSSQVAVDLLAGIAVSAVATPVAGAGVVGARAAAGSLVRGLARTAISEGARSTAAGFLRSGAGSAARTLATMGDDVATNLARSIAQQTGVAASSFTRSAGSAYVSAYSALDAQTNPAGQPLFSDEEKRKIALGTALTAGTATAAITLGFGKILGGGVEDFVTGKIGTGVLKRIFGATDDQITAATRTSALAILKAAGAEAPEEAVDQLVGNVIQALGTGEEFRLGPALKEALEAGLVGGLLGAGTKSIEVGIDKYRSPKVVALEKSGSPATAAVLEAATKAKAEAPAAKPTVINQDGLRIQDNPPLSPDPFTYGEEDPDAPNPALTPSTPPPATDALSPDPFSYGLEETVGITDTGGAVRVSAAEIEGQIDAVDVQLADLKVVPANETEGQKAQRTRRLQELNAEKVRLKAAVKNAKASGGFVFLAQERPAQAPAPTPASAPEPAETALDYGDGSQLAVQDNTLAGPAAATPQPAATPASEAPPVPEDIIGTDQAPEPPDVEVVPEPTGPDAEPVAAESRGEAALPEPATKKPTDESRAAEMRAGKPLPVHETLFADTISQGWVPTRNVLLSQLKEAGYGGKLYGTAFAETAQARIRELYPLVDVPKTAGTKTLKSLGLGDIKGVGNKLVSIPVFSDGKTAPFTNDPVVTSWQKAVGLSVKVPDGVSVNPAIGVNAETGFVDSAVNALGVRIFSKGDFKRAGTTIGSYIAFQNKTGFGASLETLPPFDSSKVSRPVDFAGFKILPGETTEDDILRFFFAPSSNGGPSKIDQAINASAGSMSAVDKDQIRNAAQLSFVRELREFTLDMNDVGSVDPKGFLRTPDGYKAGLENRIANVWSKADTDKDGVTDTSKHWNERGRPSHLSFFVKNAIKAQEKANEIRPDANVQLGSDDVDQATALERAAARNEADNAGDMLVALDEAFTPEVLRGSAAIMGMPPETGIVDVASGVQILVSRIDSVPALRKAFEQAYLATLALPAGPSAKRAVAIQQAKAMASDELVVLASWSALVQPGVVQAIRDAGFFKSISYGLNTFTDAEIGQHRADNRAAVADLQLDGDLRQAIERIARSAKYPRRYRAIALAALKMQVLPNISIVDAPAEAYAGSYTHSARLITLNIASSNGRGLLDVLAHELLHAATLEAIANPQTKTARDLVAKLERARQKAAEVVPSDMAYAVSSLDEFITHAATDPRLQVILRETLEKGKTTWQRVVEAIAKFFGIANNDFVSDLWGFINHAAEYGYRVRVAASREARSVPGTDWSRRDAEYLAAVEAGDMVTAQRMVDEAARAAGYTLPVKHATPFSFTEFSRQFIANSDPDSEVRGFHLSNKADEFSAYVSPPRVEGLARQRRPRTEVLDLFVRPGRTIGRRDAERMVRAQLRENPESDAASFPAGYDTVVFLAGSGTPTAEQRAAYARGEAVELADGYSVVESRFVGVDGSTYTSADLFRTDDPGQIITGYLDLDDAFEMNNESHVVVRDPNQIKSADPVTRDDAGNVIPLSARFRPSSPDIRYSPAAQAPDTGVDQHLPQLPAGLAYAFDDTRPKYLAYARRSQPGTVTVNRQALAVAVEGLDPANARAIVSKVIKHEIAHLAAFSAFTDADIAEMARGLSAHEMNDVAKRYYGTPDALVRLANDLESGAITNESLVEEYLRMQLELASDGSTTEATIAFHSDNPGFVARLVKYLRDALVALWRNVAGPQEDYVNRVAISRLAREYRAILRGHKPLRAEPFDPADPNRDDNYVAAIYQSGSNARDTEYLAAVEADDIETAQRLVDELVLSEMVPVELRKAFKSAWSAESKLGDSDDEIRYQAGQRAAVARTSGRLVKALETYFADQPGPGAHLPFWRSVNDARVAVKYDRDGDVVPLSTRFPAVRGALATPQQPTDPDADAAIREIFTESLEDFTKPYEPGSLWRRLFVVRTGDRRFPAISDKRQSSLVANERLVFARRKQLEKTIKEEQPDAQVLAAAAGDSSPTTTPEQDAYIAEEFAAAMDEARQVEDPAEQASAVAEAYELKQRLTTTAYAETARIKRRRIDEAFEELERTAPKTAANLKAMREGIDNISRIVKEHQPEASPLRMVFDAQDGIYLTRVYRIHHKDGDPLTIFSDPAMADVRERAQDQLMASLIDIRVAEIIEQEAEAGKIIGDTEAGEIALKEAEEQDLGRILLEDYLLAHGSKALPHNSTDFRVDLTRYFKKMPVPEALRNVLEEVTDPVELLTRTSLNVGMLAASTVFTRDLARGGYTSGAMVTGTQQRMYRKLIQEPDNGKYLAMLVDGGWAKRVTAPGYVEIAPDVHIPGWLMKAKEERDLTYLENFRPVATTTKKFGAGKLADLYAHPIVADWMDHQFTRPKAVSMDDAKFVHKMGEVFAKATGMSLGVATLGSVGFYMRNFVGDAFFLAANGINPYSAKTRRALDLAWKAFWNTENGEVTKLTGLGVLNDDLRPETIKELLKGETDRPGGLNILELMGKVLGGKKGIEYGTKTTAGLAKLADAATAIDGIAKATTYYVELETLREAYPDKPAKWHEDEAAKIVKLTNQAKSQTPPIVDSLTASSYGRLFAPFLRFEGEIFRLTGNIIALSAEEIKSDNPVIRARGYKRAAGFAMISAFSVAGPALISAMYGVGDDEEYALREALPPYLRGSSIIYIPSDDGKSITSLDFTFLNPWSFIGDPISRTGRAIMRGEPGEGVDELAIWINSNFLSEQILAGAAFEVLRNEDSDGRPITFETDSADEKLIKFSKHLVGSSFSPQSLKAVQRAYDTARRGTPEDTPFFETAAGIVVGHGFPIRPRAFETEALALKAARKQAETNRQVRALAGQLKRRVNYTEGDIEDIVADLQDSTASLNQDIARMVSGYEGLGLPKASISKQLVEAGRSRQFARAIVFRGIAAGPTITPATKRDLFEAGEAAGGAGGGEKRTKAVAEAMRPYPKVQQVRGVPQD